NSAAPGSGLLNPAESAIPVYGTTSYDSLEQKAAEVTKSAGTELWRTTITDHGDHTVTVPPTGGQVVEWTDAFDKTIKEQDYLDATNHQDTSYTYTPDHNDLASVTDPNGDTTSYTYDWLGRKLTATDPDSGPATNTYDRAGNLTSVTDAKGQKLSTGYDAMNRITSTWAGDLNTGTQLTALTYDTMPGALDQLAATTTYAGGQTYIDAVTSYDARYRVTGREYTIPTGETGLGRTYDFSYGFDGANHQTSITYPDAGGLPKETVTEQYTNIGLPTTLTGAATYVAGTTFAGDGKLTGRQYGSLVARDYTYESNTGRLSSIQTQVSGATVQNDGYAYDSVNNVSSITDHVAGQSQCFGYDGRERLTAAYTDTTDCGHPADGNGPAPYNLTYSYDGAGNITSTSQNGVTTSYTYPTQGSGSVRPHAVSAIGTNTYGYDANGDLTTRTVAGASTTLTWNVQDQVATSTTGDKTTSYIYDGAGDRLLRRDPGSTTLFLDNTELTSTGGATPVATRYYTTGTDGATVAERTPTALTWLAADGQGSEQLAIGSTGTVSRQLYLPYGAPRGTASQIPGDRGFLGRVQDASTGLDLLDSRYYDPSIGRFLSPDPMDNNDQPDTANPYAYATDNPTTFSDPTGLRPADCNASCMRQWEKGQQKAARHRAATHSSSSHRSSRSSGRSSRHAASKNTCLVEGFFCGYLPPPPCLAEAFYCGTESMAHTVPPKKHQSFWSRVRHDVGSMDKITDSGAWKWAKIGFGACAIVFAGCGFVAAGMAGAEVLVDAANGKWKEALGAGIEVAAFGSGAVAEKLADRAYEARGVAKSALAVKAFQGSATREDAAKAAAADSKFVSSEYNRAYYSSVDKMVTMAATGTLMWKQLRGE
ncbi:MAG TPA: RHS repeat-associated core domain-containing protein, partial [Rugosimonospora sp.]